jgi:hypothetical protein
MVRLGFKLLDRWVKGTQSEWERQVHCRFGEGDSRCPMAGWACVGVWLFIVLMHEENMTLRCLQMLCF